MSENKELKEFTVIKNICENKTDHHFCFWINIERILRILNHKEAICDCYSATELINIFGFTDEASQINILEQKELVMQITNLFNISIDFYSLNTEKPVIIMNCSDQYRTVPQENKFAFLVNNKHVELIVTETLTTGDLFPRLSDDVFEQLHVYTHDKQIDSKNSDNNDNKNNSTLNPCHDIAIEFIKVHKNHELVTSLIH